MMAGELLNDCYNFLKLWVVVESSQQKCDWRARLI